MIWQNSGTITKLFKNGASAFGPINLPVNFAYTGVSITVDSGETTPIHCDIVVEISFDSGVSFNPFLAYSWDFDGTTDPKTGTISRICSAMWDLPTIYRGTMVQGTITMSRSARFTIDFNSGNNSA